jgi:hypothetical protein
MSIDAEEAAIRTVILGALKGHSEAGECSFDALFAMRQAEAIVKALKIGGYEIKRFHARWPQVIMNVDHLPADSHGPPRWGRRWVRANVGLSAPTRGRAAILTQPPDYVPDSPLIGALCPSFSSPSDERYRKATRSK